MQHSLGKTLIFVSAVMILPLQVSAKVYQCTNASGEVSFSSLPCPKNEEKKAIELTDTQGAIEVDESKPYLNAPHASPMCIDAVENAQYSLGQMVSITKRNYNGGYMSKEEFDKAGKAIKLAQKEITLTTCESSTGNERAFFECMESGYTLITTCFEKHQPPMLEGDS